MSITLPLSPEEEAFLERAAAAEGRDIIAYIRGRVLPAVAAGDATHPDLAFLRDEARTAVRAAQHDLLARGIGYVYQARDGAVVRRNADGSEETLARPVPD